MIEDFIDQIADTIWDIQEDGTIRKCLNGNLQIHRKSNRIKRTKLNN